MLARSVLASVMRYEQATDGIRVRVQPRFSIADSDPKEGAFVFSYDITLSNEGDTSAQLLFRHWYIHDASGEDTEVDGDGVVGQQPMLGPGDSHQYQSYCVLRSPVGYMEGYYTFVRSDGERFRVAVPRFDLSVPFVLPSLVLDEDDSEPGLLN